MRRVCLCGSLDTALNRLLQVTCGFNDQLYLPLFLRFHESMLTQSEAKKFCEDEQQVPARLIEIDSAEENSVIIAEIKRRNFVSRKIEFWLGITDRHSEGQWVLESTGERLVFANWSSREPINQEENCAHINSKYKWMDRGCDHKTGRGKWKRTALCEI